MNSIKKGGDSKGNILLHIVCKNDGRFFCYEKKERRNETMKKVVNTFLAIATVFLLLGGVTVQAQKIDFEDKNIGDTYTHIGWSATDITAEVAADPLSEGNKVLK